MLHGLCTLTVDRSIKLLASFLPFANQESAFYRSARGQAACVRTLGWHTQGGRGSGLNSRLRYGQRKFACHEREIPSSREERLVLFWVYSDTVSSQ